MVFKEIFNKLQGFDEQKIPQMRYPNGVYISMAMTSETLENLKKWMKENDIFEEIKDPHVTIIYSRTPMKYSPVLKPNAKVSAKFKGFDLFGPKKDILVIKLDSRKLEYRFKQLTEKYKFKSDWPSYIPHTTLVCGYKGTAEDIKNFSEINFTLDFEQETVEPLDDSWGS